MYCTIEQKITWQKMSEGVYNNTCKLRSIMGIIIQTISWKWLIKFQCIGHAIKFLGITHYLEVPLKLFIMN